MSDVFISYARSTGAQAKKIADALRALGYGVWSDDQLPAHRDYAEVIQERLRAAKAVVVVWSADAAKSEWVQSEADRARADRKLVQLTVDGASLPMPFDRIQCADLMGWTGDLSAPGWRKVADSVAELAPPSGVDRRTAVTTTPLPAAAPVEPVLAVLAFDNLSGDPEMAYFSDGVSEEILDTVARGSDVKVFARSSSFQFRGSDKAVRHVTAALKATHLLDGSVRRAGARVRVAAQLVDCASETTLWSDRFDRELTDIFALQEEIAAAVAAALKTAFAPRKFPTPIDPAVYDLFLRESPVKFDPGRNDHAIGMLEEVTRRAPAFADGWATLAVARARRELLIPYAERPASSVQVKAAADRALALDPDSPSALSAKALILPPFGAFVEYEPLAERLLQLATPAAFESLYLHLLSVGRVRDALDAARRAFELDPLQSMSNNVLGECEWFAGDWNRAVEHFHASLERDPDNQYSSADLIVIGAYRGDWASVDDLLAPERLRRHPLHHLESTMRDLAALMRLPSPEMRGAILIDNMRARLALSGTVDVNMLGVAAEFSPLEEVYEIAEAGRFGPTGGPDDVIGYVAYRPHYWFHGRNTRLRSDPRFVRLCAKAGLVEYWLATQKWPDCVSEVPYDFKAECVAIAHRPLKQPFLAALSGQRSGTNESG